MALTRVRLGSVAVLAASAALYGAGAVLPASAQAADKPPGAAVHGPAVAAAQLRSTEQFWTEDRMRKAVVLDEASSDRQTVLPPQLPAVQQGPAGRADPVVGPAGVAGDAGGGPGSGSTGTKWYGSTSNPPATTSGRVFFTGNDGGSYSCSGSTVNSQGKDLVFTAGHCVHPGGSGNWVSNWTFVPGYANGSAPHGRWTARQLWSWTLWTQNGDRRYDIGVAVMNPVSGQHIVNAVGGQGIEWNYPLEQEVFQFGYPARAPFNGSSLQYCSGRTFNDGGNEGINCTMTEGASGGPWLDDFNGTLGYLDSVNSWVFWDGNGVRYKWNGPYFGNDARDLYNATAGL